MKYDYCRIHWQDFEVLSFKCLQILISSGVQFLEGGGDKGRDVIYEGKSLKFNPSWDGKWIFQIKHKCSNSGTTKDYSNLLSDLSKELSKVFIKNSLEYDNYVLVTNLKVTPDLEDKAKATFETFRKENNISCENFFVIGYRHLETCFDENDFLKWNFPNVLSQADFESLCRSVTDSAIMNRQFGWLQSINKYRKYFVHTRFYDDAYNKLKNHHTILLSGPPKSGKTFTAEILATNYSSEFGNDPLRIDNPSEIEKYYKKDSTQIFVFDDAFGSHSLSYSSAEDWNRKIEGILALANTEHKFVFTSREHVYKAFKSYANRSIQQPLEKIVVTNEGLTNSEKEAILERYVALSPLPLKTQALILSKQGSIVGQKNYSPESIRSFFSNLKDPGISSYQLHHNLISHIKRPDEFLKNLFFQFDESRRLILLSVLCSQSPDLKEIGSAYTIMCNDFGATKLESYDAIISELDGGVLKLRKGDGLIECRYYHPSMKEGIIDIIKSDENGTIHSTVLKNLNIDLLDFYSFDSPKAKGPTLLGIGASDLTSFNISLSRLFKHNNTSLLRTIRFFKWFANSSNSLIKILDKPFYKSVHEIASEAIDNVKSDSFWIRHKDEPINDWSELIWSIKSMGLAYTIDRSALVCEYFFDLLKDRSEDPDYWKIVFQVADILDESAIIDIVSKDWLNQFYKDLSSTIITLGKEILGEEFPTSRASSQSIIKPNRTWYPRFSICKEKVGYLKRLKGNPLGKPILNRIEGNYEQILRFSEYAHNRQSFNEEQGWW